MSREPGTAGQVNSPGPASHALRFSQIRSRTGEGEGGAASPAQLLTDRFLEMQRVRMLLFARPYVASRTKTV